MGEQTPFYCLATPRAVRDGAIYSHNTVLEGVGTPETLIVRCANEFLAEYQRGRLRSCIGWSGGNLITSDLTEADAETKRFEEASI